MSGIVLVIYKTLRSEQQFQMHVHVFFHVLKYLTDHIHVDQVKKLLLQTKEILLIKLCTWWEYMLFSLEHFE